jgi:predicted phosphodiesterase
MQPGRSCPLHYRYSPQVFTRDADFQTDTLYVIGGLYGNVPALETVLELAARERATLMFNGDFNWFNIDDAAFRAVNSEVLRHRALRGNVETEIADDDSDAGCGCAYPDSVGAAEVERSNQIIVKLRGTARRHANLRTQLAALPMHRVAQVGGVRVAIVHGDLESLAGWSLSQENLATDETENIVLTQILISACRVVASSHTCLPAARAFDTPLGACAVFNNGAAGMPNFRDALYGVITRIAATPAKTVAPLYGMRIGAAYADALPLRYDPQRWLREFLAQWPPGSAAHLSYYQRINAGPSYSQHDAYG